MKIKTRKKRKSHNKTRKREKKENKKEKKVKFGNSFRCIPATEKNKDKGKIINIDGESMVVIKEKTTFS
tara:strand:+ start:359 stop:565 length:207 start_codon:yes stop_codon:yes gene_type:complete